MALAPTQLITNNPAAKKPEDRGSRVRTTVVGCAVAAVLLFAATIVFGAVVAWRESIARQREQQLTDDLASVRERLGNAQDKERTAFIQLAELKKTAGESLPKSPEQEATIIELRRQLASAQDDVRASNAALADAKLNPAKVNQQNNELQKLVTRLEKQASQDKMAIELADERVLKAEQATKEARASFEKLEADLGAAKRRTRQDAVRLDAFRKRLGAVGIERDAFGFIDKHALAAPQEAEKSLESLAEYLTASAIDDREACRAIYRWLVDRIDYDWEAFEAFVNTGKAPADSPELVLKHRKAVCAGFAASFTRIAKHAGLEAVTVVGHAKGLGVKATDDLKTNHGWNAVKLDGRWHLLDSTWASNQKKNPKSIEFFFLTPPEQFVFEHFPAEPKWQLLEPAIDAEQFSSLRKLDSTKLRDFGLLSKATLDKIRDKKAPLDGLMALSKVHSSVLKLGLSIDQIMDKAQEKDFRGFPLVFPRNGVAITQAPSDRHLKAGTTQQFRIESPDSLTIVIVNAMKQTKFQRIGAMYSCEVKGQPGELAVAVMANNEKVYTPILQYTVE